VAVRADEVVLTTCPRDCYDACGIAVVKRNGAVRHVRGDPAHPVSRGKLCRKCSIGYNGAYLDPQARLTRPLRRAGAKGEGAFEQVSWDEAVGEIAERLRRLDGHTVLNAHYTGTFALLSYFFPLRFFHRLGATEVDPDTICNKAGHVALEYVYGTSMDGFDPLTARDSACVVVWGANPSASGLHLVPYIQEARKKGARLVVVDPRVTPLARQADLHLPLKPGSDLVVALAVHRHLFETGAADAAFLETQTRGAAELRARASEWTFERAASVAGIQAATIREFAEMYASASPALIRCGWGLERNRNGGSAVAAVLALPAVGGKFKVRGGGYALSNSAAWGIERTWIGADEPDTRVVNMNHLGRVLAADADPPLKVLFVYNCNPVATVPHQNLIIEGLAREDLFTIVFDQVLTDTAAYADLVLPATTFLETYDLARAYGPIALQMVQPVVDAVGESRSNPEVFGQLLAALDLDEGEGPQGELETLLDVLNQLPGDIAEDLRNQRMPVPSFGAAPVQFVDVFPRTPDGKADLFPEALARESAAGLYQFLPDPGTDRYPLALISPSSDRTINSTLGELSRPEVALVMHPIDSQARGLEEGASVRIFNERGDVRCKLSIEPTVRPGTVVLPKGLWRASTLNRSTATALAPDTLSDVGEGACFNDARVQVERSQ